MGQARGTYKRDANRVLVGTYVGMTSLGRPRSRRKNNIKMHLQLGWEGRGLNTGTDSGLLSKRQ